MTIAAVVDLLAEGVSLLFKQYQVWSAGNAEEKAQAEERMQAAVSALRADKVSTADDHAALTAETQKAIDDAKAASGVQAHGPAPIAIQGLETLK